MRTSDQTFFTVLSDCIHFKDKYVQNPSVVQCLGVHYPQQDKLVRVNTGFILQNGNGKFFY